jgi:hypothetical protein
VLRRPDGDPAGFMLDGTVYATEDAYRAALAKRAQRRRRAMASIQRERGQKLAWPGSDDNGSSADTPEDDEEYLSPERRKTARDAPPQTPLIQQAPSRRRLLYPPSDSA